MEGDHEWRGAALRGATAAWAAAWLAGGGCSDASGLPDGRVLETDSAGVRIVENELPEEPPVCPVAEEPAMEVGVMDGPPEYELHRVASSVRMPDGRVAVVNQGTHEIRFFDAEGTFLDAFGGEGDGPAEFRFPMHLWPRGDSLRVFDAGNQRLSWFDDSGTFMRADPLDPPYLNPPQLSALEDGRLVAADALMRIPSDGMADIPLFVIVHEPDGQVADTVAEYVFNRMGPVGPEGHSVVAGPLFGARTLVTASDRRIWIGTGQERELEVLGLDGELEARVRWTGPDRNVTAAHRNAYLEDLREAVESEERLDAILQQLEDRGVAERFPAIERLEGDRLGRVWVREYERPTDDRPPPWHVFQPDGTVTCTVRLPDGFRPQDRGEEYLLGVWEDDLGVERLRLYDFEPTPGG